jgi:type II secretory pathway pseudopilin PulG
MKMRHQKSGPLAAFTVVEMMVALGVLGLLGTVFFQVLNSGMVLYAKNTAVNAAHEEARQGILRLTRDIHASVTIPQLRDTSFNPVSSTPVNGVAPTAAGVSFQNITFGPCYVWKDPGGNGPIMVKGGAGNIAPTVGMHILSPFFNVEDDIIKVTATPTAANHHNIWLANGGEVLLANKTSMYGTTGATYSVLYYTNRVMYLVQNGRYVTDAQGPYILSGGNYTAYTSGTMQRYRYENGELHLYKQDYSNNALSWKDYGAVARYITSPTPFYVPLNSGGGADSKYIGVKLSARDPSSSNRGYLATAALLDTQIDYRSRIGTFQ